MAQSNLEQQKLDISAVPAAVVADNSSGELPQPAPHILDEALRRDFPPPLQPYDFLQWEKDPNYGMNVEKVTQVVIYPPGWVEPVDEFVADIVTKDKGNGVREMSAADAETVAEGPAKENNGKV